jgi:hypothetical protein
VTTAPARALLQRLVRFSISSAPTSASNAVDRRPGTVCRRHSPTVRFQEKWRIALAQMRTVLQAGFTLTGAVVDADYG